jgi:hypothetical protein
MAGYHRVYALGNSISNFSSSMKMERCRYDVINNDSRDLLTNAGISFQRLKEKGIKAKDFAEYLVASGTMSVIQELCSTLVLNGWSFMAVMISPTYSKWFMGTDCPILSRSSTR